MNEGLAHNGDIELAWESSGSPGDPTILLINGLGSPLVAYEPGLVDNFLGAGFEVVRFDNRDVGRSSRCSAPYTLDDMASDAVAVLDHLGIESTHVFGQSMGGMIAQQLAMTVPDRVLTLTSLMSSTGEHGYGTPSKAALAALLTPPSPEPDGWLANRLTTERIWCSPEFWDPAWVEAKGRSMMLRGVDPAGAARQFRAVSSGSSRDTALAALDVPTLVLHGSADTLIEASGGRHTAEVIPDARYVEIEGMGHDLPPALWTRLVDEFASFVASQR